uniref:Uncharacterized protein n=1 Tax=Dulem virus 29 TaxID=3145747 RepID=A0AAU8B2C8_9CAUD
MQKTMSTNGLYKELVDRQAKILYEECRLMKYNTYSQADMNYAERGAKDEFIEKLREAFSDEKNSFLIELEQIIERIEL